jgi:TRAP-type C4-dicarboxylate transport system permease small subunit
MADNADLAAIEGGARRPRDLTALAFDALAAIGTVWTFLLMLLICGDVIGRAFNRPITGVAEIAAHSVVAIVFLQLASAVHAKRMTRADFLIERIFKGSFAAGVLLETLFALSGAAVMAFIAHASLTPLQQALSGAEFFGVQGLFTIPTWPIRGIVVLGASVAALAYLIAAFGEVLRLKRGP